MEHFVPNIDYNESHKNEWNNYHEVLRSIYN